MKFDQISEDKRPTGAYPFLDFHQICRISTLFRDALAVKIWMDLFNGLWSYGGFKLTGSGFPKFSAPPSGETMRRTPKSFRGARTCSRSSIIMPSLLGLGLHPAPGQPKTLSFLSVGLSVCLSIRHAVERQSLCARFGHECTGVQKRFSYRCIGECW